MQGIINPQNRVNSASLQAVGPTENHNQNPQIILKMNDLQQLSSVGEYKIYKITYFYGVCARD